MTTPNSSKAQRYMQRMLDMGLTQVRLLVPVDKAEDYFAKAGSDRADYLHWLAEESQDDDPRLALLAGMNNAAPLSAKVRAELVQHAKNSQRAAKLCKELDEVQTILWAAIRDAEAADSPAEALRAQARASVASMDYRRLREDLERA
jgi:hypothetical protein